MLANIEKVKELIPQKEPFVMVDELIFYAEDTLESRFKIDPKNIFVEDNYFIEPGIIENMAQSVALHAGYQYFLQNKTAPMGYIGSIKNVELKRLPKTGETIETKVTILQEFMGVTLVDIVVICQKKIIASSQMKTVLAK
jgi:predicted hotdog family 3-hydroxylacyl-ACP dehydratase